MKNGHRYLSNLFYPISTNHTAVYEKVCGTTHVIHQVRHEQDPSLLGSSTHVVRIQQYSLNNQGGFLEKRDLFYEPTCKLPASLRLFLT